MRVMLSGSGRPALSNEQEDSTCGFRFVQEASMSGESASEAARRHLRTHPLLSGAVALN